MTHSLNNEHHLDKLMDLFQAQKITVILDQQSLKSDCYFLLDQSFHFKHSLSIGFVLAENPFLPYLSLKQNLFVGSSIKNKEQKKKANQFFTYLGIDSSILIKPLEALNFYEQIKLQLCRMLLLDKDIIIIDDIFKELSIFQRQELLPLLQKIAKADKKAILILTEDSKIAESPYMDEVIKIA
ncbi:P-loop NTPase family protein [Enterococcus rivorum]|uniref:ABC transporter domain-containing protein n=1 Tax=Enterococcus rivorum TaxID=762845 RepID=A0A1E5KWJ2_9ENTE|nr:hypothetical protein [Enterococcus rivorum]MBP2100047.1 ABC-type lipoprotein export system ATPase subunit [Enterococcus rivorum]OEH82243.1 hypothetical protein BCR26_13865 [Enterococcus rivorum]